MTSAVLLDLDGTLSDSRPGIEGLFPATCWSSSGMIRRRRGT